METDRWGTRMTDLIKQTEKLTRNTSQWKLNIHVTIPIIPCVTHFMFFFLYIYQSCTSFVVKLKFILLYITYISIKVLASNLIHGCAESYGLLSWPFFAWFLFAFNVWTRTEWNIFKLSHMSFEWHESE